MKCKSSLGHDGFSDWKHTNETLKEHVDSVKHIDNINSWNEMRTRVSKHETIDKESQQQITKETEHIRQVLFRIVITMEFLGNRNLTFRGSNEQLYDDSNGNFLACVEMVVEFDFEMQEIILHILKTKRFIIVILDIKFKMSCFLLWFLSLQILYQEPKWPNISLLF